jgi:glucosylceramidase
MMKNIGYKSVIITSCTILLWMTACNDRKNMSVQVFETSAQGHQLTEITDFKPTSDPVMITIRPDDRYQTITGFGGSFTEASAYLMNKLSTENRNRILEAYFGDAGAKYSLTRTHINSCDFSLSNYAYVNISGDTTLSDFSIQEDMDDIIPMIKDAMSVSREGFKIIASPWTAPPWMKDNKDWRGGKLLPEYYLVWAKYFSKYIDAYRQQGINIWGVTVENEPLGNSNNWESMHFTPQEMNDFVVGHLGPVLRADHPYVKILGYDQNRDEELYHWADAMYDNADARGFYDGMAVHWYASTYDYFPDALQYAHKKAPEKHLIQTEGCIDAQVPVWQNDAWYWSEEATDWGWDWAPEDKKYLHPKYRPTYRYAVDMIGCLNNHVDGWIDWNMVLDRQGGPNWFKNWCVAPVIVDPELDEVYFTPLYYVMAHFSRFIRPGAVRIGFDNKDPQLMCTATKNKDGSVVVVLFNPGEAEKGIKLNLKGKTTDLSISGKAIQTIIIN